MNCKGTQLGQSCGRIGLWTHGSFLIEFLCNWVLHMGGWHLGHIHHTDFNDTLQSTWRFLHKWVGMKSWGLTPVPGPGQPGAFQQRRCHSVGKRRAEERFHGRHGDGNCPAALHVAEKQPKRLTTYCTIYIYVHVYIYVECIYIYTHIVAAPRVSSRYLSAVWSDCRFLWPPRPRLLMHLPKRLHEPRWIFRLADTPIAGWFIISG
jgi:hypothetical protein